MHVALFLALASATCWGAGDFLGGLATRDSPAISTTFIAQASGWLGLASVSLLVSGLPPGFDQLGWGIAAGLSAVSGLGLFYAAMGAGAFGTVASVTAVTSAIVPVVVGFATGERPGMVTVIGIVVAVGAIWLIAGETSPQEQREGPSRALPMAFVAGLFFGGYFVLISRSGGDHGLWPVAAGRFAATGTLAVVLEVLRWKRPRVKVAPSARGLQLCVFGGLLDAAANALYFVASRDGMLSVVAVLASMYPASTLLLARVCVKERMSRRRIGGMTVALAAVAAVSWGGLQVSAEPVGETSSTSTTPLPTTPSASSLPGGLAHVTPGLIILPVPEALASQSDRTTAS